MARTSLPNGRTSATTILSFTLASLALVLHIASGNEDGYAGVVRDHFLGLNPRAGSRFLAGQAVKKGDSCDPVTNNICSTLPAKNGTQLLSCCKNHCRNVLTDRNNCGTCGTKCGFGRLCCKGQCTVVAYDVNNCGKCGNVCKARLRCEYGNCGYA